MKAESSFKTVVVPAGQAVPVAITGSSFYIESTTGNVFVQFDEGGELQCKSGQTVDLPPGDYFKKIVFRNPDTTSSISISYYAGTLSVGNRTPYVYVRPAPTYMISKSYAVTLGNDTAVDVTNLRTGKTIPDSRSYVIFQWVQVTAGTDSVGISYTTGWTAPGAYLTSSDREKRIESSAPLYLRGLLGANCAVYAMAFYNYDS